MCHGKPKTSQYVVFGPGDRASGSWLFLLHSNYYNNCTRRLCITISTFGLGQTKCDGCVCFITSGDIANFNLILPLNELCLGLRGYSGLQFHLNISYCMDFHNKY